MHIKFLIAGIIINLIAGSQALGQTFTVGSSGLSIQAGTPLFIDSLVLQPTASISLSSNSLSRSTTATSVNGVSSIMNQFTFAAPVTYSGTAAISYTTAQLNGNAASELVIAYNDSSGGAYTLNCSSTADTLNRVVTTALLTSAVLHNLSAVKSSVTVAAITGVSSLNVGTSATLANTTSGGTWSSYHPLLATITPSGVVTALSGGTDTIAYVVSNTCNSATAIKVMNINAHASWIGVSNSNWGDSTNWSTGIVPTSMVNAAIPAATPFSPKLITGSYSVKDVTLDSGGVVTLNSGTSLHLKGDLYNNGYFKGSGILVLDSSVSQSVGGVGHVNAFELNNTAGATITSGSKLTIDSLLTVTSGTLATGDSLVLNSDSVVTARIAALPSSGAAISGKVKVMQYVQGGYRRYRFWSHPFSSYIPLSQVQNYIDVTGTGGSANGFTSTATNAPSAYRYNPLVGNSALPSDPGWRAFTSAYGTTDTNRLKQYQGIRLFFRGAKGEGLGYGTYTPSSATVGMWGTVNQGAQTVTLYKGTSANQDYNMVGNPYASPVDIGTVLYNAKASGNIVGSAFYVWNPSLGAAGQFQAIFLGTSFPIPYYLQACNAFQVRAAHNGDTLSFSESNKGSGSTANLFKAQPGYLSLTVYDAHYHPWDMLHIQFNDGATATEDKDYDATKPSGGEFNFYSISADTQMLAIDARPYKPNSTIPLGLCGPYAQDFIIRADGIAIPEEGSVYLHDKLLKQYVLLKQGAEYHYSITDDKATQGNRFELSVEPDEVATVQNNSGFTATLYPNPAANEVNISLLSGKKAGTYVNIINAEGKSVSSSDFGQIKSGNLKIAIGKLQPGIYMVEVVSGSDRIVHKLIKE